MWISPGFGEQDLRVAAGTIVYASVGNRRYQVIMTAKRWRLPPAARRRFRRHHCRAVSRWFRCPRWRGRSSQRLTGSICRRSMGHDGPRRSTALRDGDPDQFPRGTLKGRRRRMRRRANRRNHDRRHWQPGCHDLCRCGRLPWLGSQMLQGFRDIRATGEIGDQHLPICWRGTRQEEHHQFAELIALAGGQGRPAGRQENRQTGKQLGAARGTAITGYIGQLPKIQGGACGQDMVRACVNPFTSTRSMIRLGDSQFNTQPRHGRCDSKQYGNRPAAI